MTVLQLIRPRGVLPHSQVVKITGLSLPTVLRISGGPGSTTSSLGPSMTAAAARVDTSAGTGNAVAVRRAEDVLRVLSCPGDHLSLLV